MAMMMRGTGGYNLGHQSVADCLWCIMVIMLVMQPLTIMDIAWDAHYAHASELMPIMHMPASCVCIVCNVYVRMHVCVRLCAGSCMCWSCSVIAHSTLNRGHYSCLWLIVIPRAVIILCKMQSLGWAVFSSRSYDINSRIILQLM